MIIKKAEFKISVSDKDKLIEDGVPQIAVIGRSNVGKSSFINFVCNQKRLAKTSKSPGRTRLVNYFSFNDASFYLVDLPGYGYAKVSKNEVDKWRVLIEGYLNKSKDIKNIILLLDIRHDPTQDDFLMLNYLYAKMLPFTIILTKSDKLSTSAAAKRKKDIADKLKLGIDNLIVISAEAKKGLDQILNRLDEILSSN